MKRFRKIVIGSVGGAYNFTDYEIQLSIPHKINEEVEISCNRNFRKRIVRKNGTKSVFNIICTSKNTENNVVCYLRNHVVVIKK
jgi:hypothetical protein